jgi:hypothetical protein
MAVMANCNAVSGALSFYLLSTMRAMEIQIPTGVEMDRMVPILEHAVGIQSHHEKPTSPIATLLTV